MTVPLDVLDNRLLIVIDDNEVFHRDMVKVLGARRGVLTLEQSRQATFKESDITIQRHDSCSLDSICQGQDGVAMIQQATKAGVPYSVAFVDIRMPPGRTIILRSLSRSLCWPTSFPGGCRRRGPDVMGAPKTSVHPLLRQQALFHDGFLS
jgi:hypothetical protein